MLAKLYINALGLDRKSSTAAQNLLNWKQPTKENVRSDA
jgi:hypothetical protein